ncbi:hypothetical protein IFM89_009082 [Coptis chinensis]|uniref:Uncharacterized protein n=1 Tax=Coptis chinensis TaxID=261450 RepID=A0A835IKY6_9MAGN|nr:hypothetical protein IFM89_009082 [Coptis chinensis]
MVLFVSVAMLRNMSEGANWTGQPRATSRESIKAVMELPRLQAENLVLERGENKEVLKISDERNLSCNFCKLKISIIVPLPFGKPHTSLGEVKKSIYGTIALICGASLSEGVFVGFLLSMSSTAVVLKFWVDKNSNSALHGQVTIGTLIFQGVVSMAKLAQAIVQLYDYRKVYLVGRHGPVQAACIAKELREYYSSRSLCEIKTGNFTFIKPIPPCRNVLADVFPIPRDVFGLEDLIGVLSYEVTMFACLGDNYQKQRKAFSVSFCRKEQMQKKSCKLWLKGKAFTLEIPLCLCFDPSTLFFVNCKMRRVSAKRTFPRGCGLKCKWFFDEVMNDGGVDNLNAGEGEMVQSLDYANQFLEDRREYAPQVNVQLSDASVGNGSVEKSDVEEGETVEVDSCNRFEKFDAKLRGEGVSIGLVCEMIVKKEGEPDSGKQSGRSLWSGVLEIGDFEPKMSDLSKNLTDTKLLESMRGSNLPRLKGYPNVSPGPKRKSCLVVPGMHLRFTRSFGTLLNKMAARVNDEKLDKLLMKLDVRDGVKAKFFVNILGLCESSGEKLLVLCKYLLPMKFLERLVVRTKGWRVGKEIFMISSCVS